jgi:hypothetical protein
MNSELNTPLTNAKAEVRIVKGRPREIVDAGFARWLELQILSDEAIIARAAELHKQRHQNTLTRLSQWLKRHNPLQRFH